MSPFIAAALSAAAGMLLVASSVTATPVADGTSSAKRDPLDPKASVPQVVYRPAFTGYRPGGEVKLGSWKALNEAANRIGGWRAYAREAQAPEGSATSASSPSPAASSAATPRGLSPAPSAPVGHDSHKTN